MANSVKLAGVSVYHNIIICSIQILVEELVRQLMALENNSNTFYNPTTFLVSTKY